MPKSRPTASRPSSAPSASSPKSKNRPAPSRLLLLLGIGLLLVGIAWGVRSSAWMREGMLSKQDLPTLEGMVRRQPQDALAQRYFGLRCYQADRFEEAVAAYEAAARLSPDDAATHYGLGLALYRMGQIKRAQEEFERALRADDHLAGTEYMMGCLVWTQGDPKTGLDRVRHATELAPNDRKIWWGLARLYIQVNRQKEAIAALEKAIALHEADTEYHTALAEVLLNSGHPEEAKSHLERALQIDSNYGQASALLGSFYLNHAPGLDSLDRAESLLKQAVQHDPLFPAQVYFTLGQVYVQKGQFAQAVDALKEAQRLGFRDESLFYALANACRKKGDRKAAAAYEQQFHKLSEQRLQIPAMEQRLRANANDADAHLFLARAYRYIEHQQQALRHYGIYLQLRPQASDVSKEAEQYFQTLRAEGAKLLPKSVLPEPL